MDENKLTVLNEIEYQINRSCGLCSHGDFAAGSDWGTCRIHHYEHQKHTDELRNLSIHRSGGCPKWIIDPMQQLNLHKFIALLKGAEESNA